MTQIPDTRYTWSGPFSIAYQVFGAGTSDLLYLPPFLSNEDLVAGSGIVFEDAGEHERKGVPDRWRPYRVESR